MIRPTISQVWNLTDANQFDFPENDPKYENFFQGKEAFGIAFSGGGTRAATCAHGQLRALDELRANEGGKEHDDIERQILNRARYICSNSGGTWGVVPYTYYQGDLGSYFGQYYPPNALSLKNIKELPANSFLTSVVDAKLAIKTLYNKYRRNLDDESFSQAVGEIFLQPHNIPHQKNFTLNQTSFDAIKVNNPHILESEFRMVSEQRPFLISNGTLYNYRLSLRNKDNKFHVEMTPLYVGIRKLYVSRGDNGKNLGGGYVDPFAFDADFEGQITVQGQQLIKVAPPRNRQNNQEGGFTLADVTGISGSAASMLDKNVDRNPGTGKLVQLAKWYLGTKNPSPVSKWINAAADLINSLPEIHYLSVTHFGDSNAKATEYNIGDGGPLDDLALMPLLTRKVPKIIAFCNVQFQTLNEQHGQLVFDEHKIDPDLLALFGMQRKGLPLIRKKNKVKHGFQQVFDPSEFTAMKSAFKLAAEQNKPLVYHGRHQVRSNTHFGIEAGQVEILWFYNDRCKGWENDIKPSLFADLDIGEKGKLKNFPNFKTFLENSKEVVEMYTEQATLLSNYQTWVVKENAELIFAFLADHNADKLHVAAAENIAVADV